MNMKLNLKSLALIAALAVLVISSVVAVAAAAPATEGLTSPVTNHQGVDCGDLRMDEFYACEYGGWQPTPATEGETTTIGIRCDDLTLEEYYACAASGWRPATDESILAK